MCVSVSVSVLHSCYLAEFHVNVVLTVMICIQINSCEDDTSSQLVAVNGELTLDEISERLEMVEITQEDDESASNHSEHEKSLQLCNSSSRGNVSSQDLLLMTAGYSKDMELGREELSAVSDAVINSEDLLTTAGNEDAKPEISGDTACLDGEPGEQLQQQCICDNDGDVIEPGVLHCDGEGQWQQCNGEVKQHLCCVGVVENTPIDDCGACGGLSELRVARQDLSLMTADCSEDTQADKDDISTVSLLTTGGHKDTEAEITDISAKPLSTTGNVDADAEREEITANSLIIPGDVDTNSSRDISAVCNEMSLIKLETSCAGDNIDDNKDDKDSKVDSLLEQFVDLTVDSQPSSVSRCISDDGSTVRSDGYTGASVDDMNHRCAYSANKNCNDTANVNASAADNDLIDDSRPRSSAVDDGMYYADILFLYSQ